MRVFVTIVVAAVFVFLYYILQNKQSHSLDDHVIVDIGEANDTSVKVYAPSNSTSNVAICVTVKNATLYLDEWLDFHIALGFSPIYIYDNSDAFDLDLMPYSGVYSWYESRNDIRKQIKLFHNPGSRVQRKAYENCIKRDAANSTFVALIDADEFLVLKTFDNVIDMMDKYCDHDCGQLSINWKMMGTSNEKYYSPVPVTKRNTHGHMFGTIKVIVRPSYVADDLKWWHSVQLKKGYMVDTRGKRRKANGKGGWQERQANNNGPSDIAVLHHYAFKSEEEAHLKLCVRGSAFKGGTPFCGIKTYYGLIEDQIEFDDTAWKQLTRMVPKYRVYGDTANISLTNTLQKT